MSAQIMIARADMELMAEALKTATRHHRLRDEMNAELHMDDVRLSPLTNALVVALDRALRYLAGAQ
jgi:hypothetical protein